MSSTGKTTIREWAKDDRPREKLMNNGPGALSDAELVAILIRSGSSALSALDLSRNILRDLDNDLGRLARCTVNELMGHKGMGEAKAISIVAALELGRRRKDAAPTERPRISSSSSVYEELRPVFADKSHEEFWVLLLDRANQVIGKQIIGRGGIHGTVADPKVIFKIALEYRASGLIIAHNHPSGQLRPSEADIQLTRKIIEAGRLLDIAVLDHLIITDHGFYSFADEGMM